MNIVLSISKTGVSDPASSADADPHLFYIRRYKDARISGGMAEDTDVYFCVGICDGFRMITASVFYTLKKEGRRWKKWFGLRIF